MKWSCYKQVRRCLPPTAAIPLLLLLLFSLVRQGAGADETVVGDAGSNVTLACGGGDPKSVLWVWESASRESGRYLKTDGGGLVIVTLRPDDNRVYTCQDAETNQSLHSVLLLVMNQTLWPASCGCRLDVLLFL